MSLRILQFGTSRFLQAHADLFVHEARLAGQDIGPITIVKTTGQGARDARVRAFGDPAGYPVRIRGFENGERIDREIRVASVARALDANAQWAELAEIFVEETEIVVSNVGDGGYRVDPEDEEVRPRPQEAPRSFAPKLLALLIRRFERNAKPLLILPGELVSRNGRALRALLEGLADRWGESVAFKAWLASKVTICDTLVDRIVSEPIEPIGAVTEPYALWAIQREAEMAEPFQHPRVVYTDDLEPFLRLKLHILNLGHSYVADIWRRERRPEAETVRVLLADASVRSRLLSLYEEEVLAGFAARGMEQEARRYVAATLDRFDNPYLDHRLRDIFDNHAVKVQRRAHDFIAWAQERDPGIALPRLAALAAAPAV